MSTSETTRLTCVVGARPNFVKMAPILRAARSRSDISTVLVHTGQHYDERMSDAFFDELGIPAPDVHLGVGSGSHAVQTAKVLMAFDDALEPTATDVVVVVGDVNSTLACALVAAKKGVAVAHVEAGLRSFDRRMPEELNRVLTDQISDFLFTTERTARDHLRREGIPDERVYFVGNVMIDTLLQQRERSRHRTTLSDLGLQRKTYALCTLHRPSNVDQRADAENTVSAVSAVSELIPVLLPLHPRSRAKLEEFGLLSSLPANVRVVDPFGYLDFLALMDNAALVLTDSGGIQEETTALGVPCLTFRENTERPITITEGTNTLVGTSPLRVREATELVLSHNSRSIRTPELWDGRASARILDVLSSATSGRRRPV